MLERGGVKDDLRPELLEDLPDPACIADVGQRRLVGVKQGPAVQCQLDRVQGGFVAVQHDQLSRPELVQLTAELGADGPASAGHQNPLAGEAAGDRGDIGYHRPAAEQVSDLRIAHAVNACAAAEQFIDRRDHLRREPAALGRGGQLTDRRAARPGDGDHEHLGAGCGGHGCHLVTPAENRNSPDPQPPQGWVVVEHRHRAVVGAMLAGQPLRKLGARAAGPEDYDLDSRGRGGAGALPDRECYVPHTEHRWQGEDHRASTGGQRRTLTGHQQAAQHAKGQRRPGGRLADGHDLVEAAPLVPPRIEAGQHARGCLHETDGQRGGHHKERLSTCAGEVAGGPGSRQETAEPGSYVVACLGRDQPEPMREEGP